MRVGPVIKTSLFSSLPPPRLIVGSTTKRLFFSEIRFGKKGSLAWCRGYTCTCAAYAWNTHTPSVLEPMLILSGCSKEGGGKKGFLGRTGCAQNKGNGFVALNYARESQDHPVPMHTRLGRIYTSPIAWSTMHSRKEKRGASVGRPYKFSRPPPFFPTLGSE